MEHNLLSLNVWLYIMDRYVVQINLKNSEGIDVNQWVLKTDEQLTLDYIDLYIYKWNSCYYIHT